MRPPNNKIYPLTKRQLHRFYTSVKQSISGCWTWFGYIDETGRARFKYNGIRYRASRVGYYLFYRIDPGDECVCHTCDNPSCVNPEHLWLGTQTQNILDMNIKKRHGNTTLAGEQIGTSKLTTKEILTIRESNLSQNQLAKKYSVTQSLISMIQNKRIWKHV